jgi:uncharacterized membrane protein
MKANTGKIVRLAVLVAIMLIFEATGIGYIKLFAIELTLMQVPVIVGAIVLGPGSGAFLGAVFGLTSFWEALSGKSMFGATMLAINPLYTVIVAVVARVLMGYLCGVIFKAIHRIDRTKFLSFSAASLSGALLNTLFFMSFLIILFGRTEFIMSLRGDMPLLPFLVAFVGVQGLIEAVVCAVSGTAISKALFHFDTIKPKE